MRGSMKVSGRVALCVAVVGVLLLMSSAVYADNLKESIELYIQDPSLDFLGRGFDKILFEKVKQGEGNYLIRELKFTIDDIRTLPEQARALGKIVSQSPNTIAYGGLGGLYSTKMAVGAAKFNRMMWSIIKSTKDIEVGDFVRAMYKGLFH